MSQPPSHDMMLRIGADVVSAGAVVGAIMGYLPGIAALGAIIWYAIQIWESKTVQKRVRAWRRKHKGRARARTIHVQAYDRAPPRR